MYYLNKTHSDLVHMFSVGKSYEGRPLYVLKVMIKCSLIWLNSGISGRWLLVSGATEMQVIRVSQRKNCQVLSVSLNLALNEPKKFFLGWKI